MKILGETHTHIHRHHDGDKSVFPYAQNTPFNLVSYSRLLYILLVTFILPVPVGVLHSRTSLWMTTFH